MAVPGHIIRRICVFHWRDWRSGKIHPLRPRADGPDGVFLGLTLRPHNEVLVNAETEILRLTVVHMARSTPIPFANAATQKGFSPTPLYSPACNVPRT